MDLEITCQEVKQLRDGEESFVLLDCREAEEFGVANIDGARLLPMSELEVRHAELADHQDDRIVVYCHHGMRSARVSGWLRQQGYAKVQSMAGGIDQWSVEIDPQVPRY